MNEKIVEYLKHIIVQRGMSYKNVSEKSGVKYHRLMEIFNGDGVVSGSELICLGKALGVEYSEMIELVKC